MNSDPEDLMPMSPQLSVIVPIYNTEKYLEKCLQSICPQTLTEIEIICINDCSQDNSQEIVDHFAAKDPRIVAIKHEKNLGQGGARNTGIQRAKGAFIGSVDSDDYIDPDMFGTMLLTAQNSGADIVACGFDMVDEQGVVLNKYQLSNSVLKAKEWDIFRSLNKSFWNKIWRKDLLERSRVWFPEHLFCEDLATTPIYMLHAHKIAMIEQCLYKYLIRQGSTSNTLSDKNIMDFLEVFSILAAHLKRLEVYAKYKRNFHKQWRGSIEDHAKNIIKNFPNDQNRREYLTKLLLVKKGFQAHFDRVHDLEDIDLETALGSRQKLGLFKGLKAIF